jgi:activating signal cointegrator 1
MRALSLLQPWAALITIGAKVYETRTWGITYRGPLAIHAAVTYPPWARALAEEPEFFQVLRGRQLYGWNLERGAVVGVVDLVGCHQLQRDGVVDGIAVCQMERAFGDFRRGRFAWQFDKPRLLRAPIPARGSWSLWDWDAPTNLEELLTLKTPAELTA